MSLLDDVFEGFSNFRKILARAHELEEAHYKKEGWTKDEHGNWVAPDGEFYFDGPGSHVSLGGFIDKAASELDIDTEHMTKTANRVKKWWKDNLGR